MISQHPDDKSPIHSRRRARIGFPEDHQTGGHTFIVRTCTGEVWVLTADRAVMWLADQPGRVRSWPLILTGFLAVDSQLDLTLLVAGREVRYRDLGEVVAITVEESGKPL